jgi:hypothetical protein
MEKKMKNILFFSLLFTLVACSPSPATLQAFPPQTQPANPTVTLRPTIAPTSTDSPIFATLTAIALLPTQTSIPPTSTPGAEINQGGVLIAKGDSQLILYGQRAGTSAQEVHIVDNKTFAEITTQPGVQLALSGSGPSMFAYFADQEFSSSGGTTALADVSVGSTDDPNVSIGFLWSSQINGKFPAPDLLNSHENVLSVQAGQPVELEGWLEFGQIWTSDSSLSADQQQEGFSFFLFHHDEDIYLLGFLPNYQTVLPADDPVTYSGPEHTYLVRGFTGESVYLPLGGMLISPVPILQLSDIEGQ